LLYWEKFIPRTAQLFARAFGLVLNANQDASVDVVEAALYDEGSNESKPIDPKFELNSDFSVGSKDPMHIPVFNWGRSLNLH